jgi:hypothetical protein
MNFFLKRQIDKLRLPLTLFFFVKGLYSFRRNRETPYKSYYAMRSLYSITNGRFNDLISWIQQLRHPKYTKLSFNGILGNLQEEEVKDLVSQIKKNGYYVAPQKLSSDFIDRIVQFCKDTPAEYLKIDSENFQQHSTHSDKIIFDNLKPISPIYRFNMQQIFGNLDLLSLILDQSLLAVAQEYLNCSPVLDLVSLWWSAPFNGKGKSQAAQEFHYDVDRIKFLKVFIYLTNVDPENGPHCYVRQSHKRKPKALLSDGRKSDYEIKTYYSESQIDELCGSQGTIIFADTSGFHKGKPLTNGYRLIFQLEYANSLFGANYPKIKVCDLPYSPELKQLVNKYPRTYGQILDRVDL